MTILKSILIFAFFILQFQKVKACACCVEYGDRRSYVSQIGSDETLLIKNIFQIRDAKITTALSKSINNKEYEFYLSDQFSYSHINNVFEDQKYKFFKQITFSGLYRDSSKNDKFLNFKIMVHGKGGPCFDLESFTHWFLYDHTKKSYHLIDSGTF